MNLIEKLKAAVLNLVPFLTLWCINHQIHHRGKLTAAVWLHREDWGCVCDYPLAAWKRCGFPGLISWFFTVIPAVLPSDSGKTIARHGFESWLCDRGRLALPLWAKGFSSLGMNITYLAGLFGGLNQEIFKVPVFPVGIRVGLSLQWISVTSPLSFITETCWCEQANNLACPFISFELLPSCGCSPAAKLRPWDSSAKISVLLERTVIVFLYSRWTNTSPFTSHRCVLAVTAASPAVCVRVCFPGCVWTII